MQYYDPGRVFREVDLALMTYSTLRPKTDNFSRQGPIQLLICLFGPLQCGLHNIPIEVWLPKVYPREAPLVYIVPTMGATIRPTNMVDASGRVIHPMLMRWRGDFALAEVLRVIAGALALDPPFFVGAGRPVYSYGAQPQIIQQQQQQQQLPPHLQPIAQTTRPQFYQPPAALQSPVTGYQIQDLPELRRMMKERMNIRFRKLQTESALESDRLLAEHSQLEQGENRLNAALHRFKNDIKSLEEKIETIRKQKEFIVEMAKKDEIELDYDTLVVPQGPIAKQIMELHIEQMALEDVMYDFSKVFLLGKGNITLPMYLKHIRELAREQFMNKALLAKIRLNFPIIQ